VTRDQEIVQAIQELIEARRDAAAVIRQAVAHLNAAHARLAETLALPPDDRGGGSDFRGRGRGTVLANRAHPTANSTGAHRPPKVGK